MQSKTPHCCVINAKPLVLTWLEAAAVQRLTRGSHTESYGFIQTVAETKTGCPNLFPPAVPIWCHGTKDTWGGENWSVSRATTARRPDLSEGMRPAGWLPTRVFAELWLSFVTQAEHPVTLLPWKSRGFVPNGIRHSLPGSIRGDLGCPTDGPLDDSGRNPTILTEPPARVAGAVQLSIRSVGRQPIIPSRPRRESWQFAWTSCPSSPAFLFFT